MAIIENELLRVSVQPRGAELQSIYHKKFELEYMWQADPAFWGKSSPVLFPIVGTLKDDTYFFKGKAYKLSRHGFAREMEFEIVIQSSDSITLGISHNEATLAKFPFQFRFLIRYDLSGDTLRVSYLVTNPGDEPLYFSVGGHPAFRVPLADDTAYSDYFLSFSKKEHVDRWPISPEGLIDTTPELVLADDDRLALTKELFMRDALVFKHVGSPIITLRSDKTERGLAFDRKEFPYLGIWAAKNADFVCIEPWCGIADAVSTDQQLEVKEGIELLEPGSTFERTWSVRMF